MCPLHELHAGRQRGSSRFGAGGGLPQPGGGGELSILSLSDPISHHNMLEWILPKMKEKRSYSSSVESLDTVSVSLSSSFLIIIELKS